MKTENINVNIRMDKNIKQQMDALCQDLGTNLSTAFNIFAKAMLRHQGFPFPVVRDISNAETLAALAETKEIMKHPESHKGYRNVDTMFEDILKNE